VVCCRTGRLTASARPVDAAQISGVPRYHRIPGARRGQRVRRARWCNRCVPRKRAPRREPPADRLTVPRRESPSTDGRSRDERRPAACHRRRGRTCRSARRRRAGGPRGARRWRSPPGRQATNMTAQRRPACKAMRSREHQPRADGRARSADALERGNGARRAVLGGRMRPERPVLVVQIVVVGELQAIGVRGEPVDVGLHPRPARDTLLPRDRQLRGRELRLGISAVLLAEALLGALAQLFEIHGSLLPDVPEVRGRRAGGACDVSTATINKPNVLRRVPGRAVPPLPGLRSGGIRRVARRVIAGLGVVAGESAGSE